MYLYVGYHFKKVRKNGYLKKDTGLVWFLTCVLVRKNVDL